MERVKGHQARVAVLSLLLRMQQDEASSDVRRHNVHALKTDNIYKVNQEHV